jgi:hypothetical protein
MGGLLADANIDGHVVAILRVLNGEGLRELWEPVELPLLHFRQLGLTPDVADDVLWQVCQQRKILLITGNRNDDGPDSLEATIRIHNNPTALPVFTLATPEEVLANRAYADRVATRLLEYIYDIEGLRGTGRLFLP